MSINHCLCLLWLCCFLGTESALQALNDLEADKRFQSSDTVLHALVVSHLGSEFKLLIVMLIVQCKATIALMRFAQALIRTASRRARPQLRPRHNILARTGWRRVRIRRRLHHCLLSPLTSPAEAWQRNLHWRIHRYPR